MNASHINDVMNRAREVAGRGAWASLAVGAGRMAEMLGVPREAVLSLVGASYDTSKSKAPSVAREGAQ